MMRSTSLFYELVFYLTIQFVKKCTSQNFYLGPWVYPRNKFAWKFTQKYNGGQTSLYTLKIRKHIYLPFSKWWWRNHRCIIPTPPKWQQLASSSNFLIITMFPSCKKYVGPCTTRVWQLANYYQAHRTGVNKDKANNEPVSNAISCTTAMHK